MSASTLRVDTRLQTSVWAPGELVRGHVYIRGGALAQTIDTITLAAVTAYEREVDGATWSETYTLASHCLTEVIQIGPGARLLLPFSIQLPWETPLTLGQQRIWLRTMLEAAGADSAKRTEIVHIRPHPAQRLVLDALAAQSFQLTRTECRYQPRPGHAHSIVQALKFLPTSRSYQAIEELEIVFDLGEHGLDVLFQIVQRARGLTSGSATVYPLGRRYARIHVPHTGMDRNEIAGLVEQAICEAAYA
jgi:sporulation-control protein